MPEKRPADIWQRALVQSAGRPQKMWQLVRGPRPGWQQRQVALLPEQASRLQSAGKLPAARMQVELPQQSQSSAQPVATT